MNEASLLISTTRTFLFLQGVASPFFARLAAALEASGHGVVRVNFNAGDAVYWLGRKSSNYRGSLASLAEYLEDLYVEHGVTDQVLFGDRRPVHRPAVERAERFGIRTHVFEEGYFRPFWVTLERDGVNGHSLLPRDPDWFRRAAEHLPEPSAPERFRTAFRKRAFYDVMYHLPGLLNSILYPYYRTHAPISAPLEYAGYVGRWARLPFWRNRDAALVERLCGEAAPLYILPLQLNTDAQIRDHSRFQNMLEVLEYVLSSFSQCASADARLLIKNHPLDMGLVNYPKHLRLLAQRYQLQGRVWFVETGNLDQILDQAAGVVTVNSTVGMLALDRSCPTLCLSDPVYNLPGLTAQCGLDEFWEKKTAPDPVLHNAFKQVVTFATQVNGGFYCADGMALAVRNSAEILVAHESPLEWLLRVCPP